VKIFIDADAYTVQSEVIDIAGKHQHAVTLVKSYSHYSIQDLPSYVNVVYVDKGADMADFEILKLANKGDLIITQDYGLASLALGKKCHVMHHKGFMYTKHNIDRLLSSRHANQVARRAGHRTKGPKAFTQEDRELFTAFLEDMLVKINSEK